MAYHQPDLFIVMNKQEMNQALDYYEANLNGETPAAKVLFTYGQCGEMGVQPYKLSIQGYDAANFIRDGKGDHRFTWPMTTCYILLPYRKDGESDHIALAMATSLWPESHEIDFVIEFLKKRNYAVEDNVSRFYYKFAKEAMEDEAEYAKENPMASPWTIRDAETLGCVLKPGTEDSPIESKDDVEYIQFVKQTNIQLEFYCSLFSSIAGNYVRYAPNTIFNFPNVIVIHAKSGKKINIYVGPDVSIEEIREILSHNELAEYTTEMECPDDTDGLYNICPDLFPSPRTSSGRKKGIN